MIKTIKPFHSGSSIDDLKKKNCYSELEPQNSDYRCPRHPKKIFKVLFELPEINDLTIKSKFGTKELQGI